MHRRDLMCSLLAYIFVFPNKNFQDPVCGSAHCALASYWRKKLGKCDFVALAASPRGGVVKLHLDDEKQRVFLRGKAVAVMEGSLLV
ncbi:hypothetical protein MTR67_040546 [Solanum verrucosum]|uniref:Uncharacterized protein n=1 Tax=Solanum verrucosum TaxID=315347 RepID=A0AAF0ZPW5_SOLVR|nr:hypothetical protein MTR67_040546 [Solanum verrucosum]